MVATIEYAPPPHGMGFVTELTKLSGTGIMLYRTKAYPTPEYRYEVLTELTELSGKGIKVLQNSQNLSGTGMLLYRTYRTHSPGTGNTRVNTPGMYYTKRRTLQNITLQRTLVPLKKNIEQDINLCMY